MRGLSRVEAPSLPYFPTVFCVLDYIARRLAEGKSRRDATRLLKRYLARHLYRLLQSQEPLAYG